jgi:hypothetical protein
MQALDSREKYYMIIKLHKMDDNGHQYWEGWIANGETIFHWGRVGEMGERKAVPSKHEEDAETFLQRECAAMEADGFKLIDRESMVGIAVNYSLKSWGDNDDLETRHYLEDLCDQSLGWTGNGHCDGGDIGGGLMNIWCLVLEIPAAINTLSRELQAHGLAEGALIARYDKSSSQFVVAWPETREGQVVLI